MLIDSDVLSPYAKTIEKYLGIPTEEAGREEKDKYDDRVIKVKHGTFTLLVFVNLWWCRYRDLLIRIDIAHFL